MRQWLPLMLAVVALAGVGVAFDTLAAGSLAVESLPVAPSADVADAAEAGWFKVWALMGAVGLAAWSMRRRLG